MNKFHNNLKERAKNQFSNLRNFLTDKKKGILDMLGTEVVCEVETFESSDIQCVCLTTEWSWTTFSGIGENCEESRIILSSL